MISRLRGELIEKDPTRLVIEAGGVGYEVEIPLSVYRELDGVGSKVTILTHMVAKDDGMRLYGFCRPPERDLFRHLLAVAGVGPRVALSLLSTMKVEDLETAVLAEDVDSLTTASGVGKKTARRVIVDLKPRLEEASLAGVGITAGVPAAKRNLISAASEALVTLGFTRRDAWSAVSRVLERHGQKLELEEVVRRALKEG